MKVIIIESSSFVFEPSLQVGIVVVTFKLAAAPTKAPAMANSTFIVSRKPRLSVNLMVFYRTPTIQGIWDLESNWGINAGIRYSFLKNCAILSLQCNDLFETIYPKTKVRFESQYQDVNESAYRRSVTLSFTYKFKGYKNKQYKEVDTSRFGIQ